MDYLLTPIGSLGDVHPFVAVGRALRASGHRVTLITNERFETLARRAGLEFAALNVNKPAKVRLWDLPVHRWPGYAAWRTVGPLGRRWRKLARTSSVLPMVRPVYEAIELHHILGRTAVLAPGTALGARVAQERLGLPLVTIHLSPFLFRSAVRPPLHPPLNFPAWTSAGLRRTAYRLVDALVLDPLLGPPLNRFRGELGLAPVRRVVEWRDSPLGVVGLFPDWFAAPQPDWPSGSVATGFPLFDEGSLGDPLPAGLPQFLDAGPPPVVVLPSSSVQRGGVFFATAIEVCRRLALRGLMLTRYPAQLPARLPPGIGHAAYAPLSRVLPRAAAVVHHGGVGTAAQALAAGVPQLVVPHKNDQPDNAARLEALGVARVLPPWAFEVDRATEALRYLLSSPAVAARCRLLAERLQADDPVEQTRKVIEQLTDLSRYRGEAA